MRALLAAVVLVVVGCGPESEVQPEVSSQRQALGTAWLFELDGQSAGFVSAATSSSGGSPCGATALRFSLGPNMSVATRSWLNGVLAGSPGQHSAAIWISSTQQRLAFSLANVTKIEFPLAQAGNTSQVFFTLHLTAAGSCTTVSPSVMAAKNQLAATWAARYGLSKDVKTKFGPVTNSTRASVISQPRIGDVKFTYNVSESAALITWMNSLLNKKVIEQNGALVVPHDQFGVPLIGLALDGKVVLLDPGTPTLDATVSIDHPRLGAILPDGGVGP